MDFSGSKALSDAFSTLKARFGVMLGTALIFYLALFAVFGAFAGSLIGVMMAAEGQDPLQTLGGMGLTIVALYLLVYGITFAQQIALTRLCSDRHDATIGDAIGTGFKGMPSLFAAVFLLVLVGGAVGAILGIVIGLIMAVANSALFSLVLGVLALVCFLYLMARLSMIVPVIAIDDVRNPITAISRSWRITGPAVLKIALVYFAAIAAIVALYLAIAAVTLGTGAVMAMGGGTPNPASFIGFGIGMLVLGLTVGLYMVALGASIHRQLSDGGAQEAGETFS